MDKEKTQVVFRRWNKSVDQHQSVIALFPNVPCDTAGLYCLSYEHVGQHGDADYGHVVANSKPVSVEDQEVKNLMAELKQIGYDLEVLCRSVKGYRNRRRILYRTGELVNP